MAEEIAFLGLDNSQGKWCYTFDFLGYLNRASIYTCFCIQRIKGSKKCTLKEFMISSAFNSLIKKGKPELKLVSYLFKTKKVVKVSTLLHKLLTESNKYQDVYSKVIHSIPKKFQPQNEVEKIDYSKTEYEFLYVAICLCTTKDILVLDRNGIRMKQLVKLIRLNEDLIAEFTKAGLDIALPQAELKLLKTPKPLPLPVTPLPYRKLAIDSKTDLIKLFHTTNQVPLIGGEKLLSIIENARSIDQDRFHSYILYNIGIDISKLTSQEAVKTLEDKVIKPFYSKFFAQLKNRKSPESQSKKPQASVQERSSRARNK